MAYYVIGHVIRELRVRKQMTQEDVADGICTPATLSKIENGSQMPSKRIVDAIMHRLGDTGYFFTGFCTLEEMNTGRELVEALWRLDNLSDEWVEQHLKREENQNETLYEKQVHEVS